MGHDDVGAGTPRSRRREKWLGVSWSGSSDGRWAGYWCGRRVRRRLVLVDLHTVFHVLWPVRLLTGLVAVVGVPTAVVLGLFHTVATLWGVHQEER